MIVTVDWIREKYKKFNEMYFNNELPNNIEFKVSRSRNSWGYAGYIVRRSTSKLVPEYISISNYYDSPEHVKECTLIHEMIHVKDYAQHPEHFWDGRRRNRYYDSHGTWFQNEAKRFMKFGYNVTAHITQEEKDVSTLSDRSKRLLDMKKSNAVILAVFGEQENVFYFKTSRQYASNIMKRLAISKKNFEKLVGGVIDIKAYTTDSELYANARNCVTKIFGCIETAESFDNISKEHNFICKYSFKDTLDNIQSKLN